MQKILETPEMRRHMKKTVSMIICLIMCGLLLAGCGAKKEEETPTTVPIDEAVVGTWTEDYFDAGYIFNADGSGRDVFWNVAFTYTAHDGVLTIVYDEDPDTNTVYGTDRFNYTVEDSVLTMTRQSDTGNSFTYHK